MNYKKERMVKEVFEEIVRDAIKNKLLGGHYRTYIDKAIKQDMDEAEKKLQQLFESQWLKQ